MECRFHHLGPWLRLVHGAISILIHVGNPAKVKTDCSARDGYGFMDCWAFFLALRGNSYYIRNL